MSKHNFVRSEFKTTYSNLNNTQFIIYCTGCGYVSYNSNSGGNHEKQLGVPKECGTKLDKSESEQ